MFPSIEQVIAIYKNADNHFEFVDQVVLGGVGNPSMVKEVLKCILATLGRNSLPYRLTNFLPVSITEVDPLGKVMPY